MTLPKLRSIYSKLEALSRDQSTTDGERGAARNRMAAVMAKIVELEGAQPTMKEAKWECFETPLNGNSLTINFTTTFEDLFQQLKNFKMQGSWNIGFDEGPSRGGAGGPTP